MPLRFPVRAGTLVALALHLFVGSAHAAKWRAIPPEDFAVSPPEFDPTAGALILLRDIEIDCGGISGGDFDEGEVASYVRILALKRSAGATAQPGPAVTETPAA